MIFSSWVTGSAPVARQTNGCTKNQVHQQAGQHDRRAHSPHRRRLDADGGAATGTVPGFAQQEPDEGKCRDPANHQLLPKEQQFMPGAKQQIRQLGAIVADPQAKKLEHKTQRHHQM
jgi:hypothetical protein